MLLTAVATGSMVAGCILPIPPDKEPPFDVADLEFVVPGETDREDIEACFTGLSKDVELISHPDDPVAIYHGIYFGGGLVFCGGNGYVFGCDEIGFGATDYIATFQIDIDDKVVGYELIKHDDGEQICGNFGVCVDNRYIIVAGSKTEDTRAKEFFAPGDGCSVYVYVGDNPTDFQFKDWFFSLDSSRPRSLTAEGFSHLMTKVGSHTLSVGHRYVKTSKYRTVDFQFECSSGEIIFLEGVSVAPGFFKPGRPEVRRIKEALGMQAIMERSLILAAYRYKN